jgi:hypothetical protein
MDYTARVLLTFIMKQITHCHQVKWMKYHSIILNSHKLLGLMKKWFEINYCKIAKWVQTGEHLTRLQGPMFTIKVSLIDEDTGKCEDLLLLYIAIHIAIYHNTLLVYRDTPSHAIRHITEVIYCCLTSVIGLF